ncbi:MAG: hypothetical protein MJ117_02765, partial [Lachnospiraceae bacterium]|nr:hypothetical protein [Lachnospiraceae bacterium]
GLNTDATELIIPHLILNIIQAIHPVVALLLMVGFFVGSVAVGISTADSFLLVTGSIISEDILYHTLGLKMNEKQRLLCVRLVIAVVGSISVIFALNPPDLIFTLIMFAIAIVMPLFPILVLAIYWKRATKQGALAGAVVGTLLVLATYFIWDLGNTWYGAIGMLGALISMVVVSLITKEDAEESREFFQALEEDETASKAKETYSEHGKHSPSSRS